MKQSVTRIVVLLAVLVSACGPLPMPFTKGSEGSRNDLIYQSLPPVVAVNAVNGTSVPMAKLLAQAVAEELSGKEVIAYAGDKGSSTHVLDGWVEGTGGQDRTAAPTHILWALTKRDGELIATFQHAFQASSLDWDYGSPRVIREIGEGTALKIAELLVGAVDPAEQRVTRKDGVWLVPVIDAPGDGNFSLTRAMGYALGDQGIKMVKAPAEAEFQLKAQVRVDSPVSDQQQVKIDWILIDENRTEVGRATQSNTVPAGTFNGRWGQTAVMIAQAAAGSVRDIVNRERNRRLNSRGNGLILPFKRQQTKEPPSLPPPSLTPDPGSSEAQEPQN